MAVPRVGQDWQLAPGGGRGDDLAGQPAERDRLVDGDRVRRRTEGEQQLLGGIGLRHRFEDEAGGLLPAGVRSGGGIEPQLAHQHGQRCGPEHALRWAESLDGQLEGGDPARVAVPVAQRRRQPQGCPSEQYGIVDRLGQLQGGPEAFIGLQLATAGRQRHAEADQGVGVLRGRAGPQRDGLLVARDGLIGGGRGRSGIASPHRPRGSGSGCGPVDGGHGGPVADEIGDLATRGGAGLLELQRSLAVELDPAAGRDGLVDRRVDQGV